MLMRSLVDSENKDWAFYNIFSNACFYIKGVENKAESVQSIAPHILRIYCNDGSAYIYDDSIGRAIYIINVEETRASIIRRKEMFKIWFSRNLKWIIQGHCYNQEKLAKDLEVSVGTISNWVRGTTYPNSYHLAKMATLFNIPITDFYDFI